MTITEFAKQARLRDLTLYVATGAGSCPFACDYCFWPKAGPLEEMPVQVLHDAIDFLRRTAETPVALRFFGTEPLMRFDLIQEARAYAPELQISITTNGYLLDDERVEWLAANDVKVYVYSIDGGPEHHDKHRRTVAGAPTWERVAENFQKLLPYHGKWIAARVTWSPEGGDYDLVGRFRALEALGAKHISVVPALGANGWDEARVAQAYMELADYYAGALPPSTMLLRPLRRLESGDTRPTGNLCRVGYAMWGVLPDGTLLLCHNGIDLPQWRLGSIYSREASEEAVAISRAMDGFSTDRPECSECCARNICMGCGCCAAEFLRLTGSVTTPPESYCAHLRGMATGLKYWLSLRHREKVLCWLTDGGTE